ncbi:hypothetical protein CBS470a_002748 [Colletotrichum nupharicola]|nr:hypothetical protein CBS470a_002748 [Colletotrichum nupharicola]
MNEKHPGPAWIPTTYVEEQTTAAHEQSSESSNYMEESSKAQEKLPSAKGGMKFTKDQFMELFQQSFKGEEPQFDEAAARILSRLDLGSAADKWNKWTTHATSLENELEKFREDMSRRDRDPLPGYEPQRHPVKVRESNSEARLQEAQSDKWPSHGGSAEPLNAEAFKKPRRYQDSSSGDSGRDESDYQQSTTTRTTRYTAIKSEDVIIKVNGSTVLKIGEAEIQCQDGGEINISQPDRNDGGDQVSTAANGVEGTELTTTASTTEPSTVWDELDDLKSRIHRLEMTGKLPKISGAVMSRTSDERPPTATNTVYSDDRPTRRDSRPLPIRASRSRRPTSDYGPISQGGPTFSEKEIGQSQGPKAQQEQDEGASMNTKSDPVDYPTHHPQTSIEESHEFTDADLDHIDEWAKAGLPEGVTLGQAFSQAAERMLNTVPPRLEVPPNDKDPELSEYSDSSVTEYPEPVPPSERMKFGDYTR